MDISDDEKEKEDEEESEFSDKEEEEDYEDMPMLELIPYPTSTLSKVDNFLSVLFFLFLRIFFLFLFPR